MANPQPTEAHLRIAHSINEQLMVSHFSEQQRRILDFILRLSWGCGRKDAHIPHQKDFEIVGVREGHVKAHLVWLVEAKVIFRQECYYQFNKDFDQWRVSRATGYSKKKLTELVSLNLNHNEPVLTENVSKFLQKTEEIPYGKRKPPTPKLASPKERLKKVLKKDIYILPEWIDKELWNDFVEMRMKMRKPPTDRAKVELIKDLEKLKSTGDDPSEMLKQSIKNNWAGLFPLKGGQGGAYRRNTKIPSTYSEPPYDAELEAEVEADRRSRAQG